MDAFLPQFLAQVKNPVLTSNFQSFRGYDFFNEIMPNIVLLALIIGVVYFFFVLISGAISWISSGGDKQKVEDARKRITSAITGLLILLLIFVFTQLLNLLFGINIGELGSGGPGGSTPTSTSVASGTCICDMGSIGSDSCTTGTAYCIGQNSCSCMISCQGCVAGDYCRPGSLDYACGTGGVDCVVCTTLGMVCEFGSCVASTSTTGSTTSPTPTTSGGTGSFITSAPFPTSIPLPTSTPIPTPTVFRPPPASPTPTSTPLPTSIPTPTSMPIPTPTPYIGWIAANVGESCTSACARDSMICDPGGWNDNTSCSTLQSLTGCTGCYSLDPMYGADINQPYRLVDGGIYSNSCVRRPDGWFPQRCWESYWAFQRICRCL